MIRLRVQSGNTFRRRPAGILLWILIVPSIFYSRQNQTQKVLRHDAAAVVKLVPIRVLDANEG